MEVLEGSRRAILRLKHRIPADVRIRARMSLFAAPRLSSASWLILDHRTRANRIGPQTAIVLDGYHRSANSFAAMQFRLANPDVRVSSHLHNPSAIVTACRRRIPAVVLIRDPYDAVPSLMQLMVGASPATAISMWMRYYSVLEPFLDEVVIGDFAEVIVDFGNVVHRCNLRWGTAFLEPPATAPFQRAVRARIQEGWQGNPAVPLPSSTRRTSQSICADFSPSDREALEAARSLYRSIKRNHIVPEIG